MKEKIIFWPLLAVFIGILIFGSLSQERKKEATKDLLQDIELATKKSKAKIGAQKDKRDFESVKVADTTEGYSVLLKRSPFFRVSAEPKVKNIEAIPVKEEPKKPVLKYKGRIMMGEKVKVVIQDEGTGKSFFVQEGDMVGDFLVLRIDEKEVALKKKGGEEVVLRAVKEEKQKKKEKE